MSTIQLKDFKTDALITIDYANFARVILAKTFDTHCKIELKSGEISEYEFGIDGMRRLTTWIMQNASSQMQFYSERLGIPWTPHGANADATQEQVLALSHGRAALEDIVSHSASFLEALGHRKVAARQHAEAEARKAARSGEPSDCARDDEAYWQRECDVMNRMVFQARVALAAFKPKDGAA